MTAGEPAGARIVGGDIDRNDIIRLLDDEFLTARGRSGSLAWRLPDLFDDPQSHIQVVLTSAGDLAAACCCKRFAWRYTDGRRVSGGMIGLVVTAPAYRGQGHGRRVVDDAAKMLAGSGIEIATLWTKIPAFYAKLGWRRGVSGTYGPIGSLGREIQGASTTLSWTAAPFDAQTIDAIEFVRTGSTGPYVLRAPLTYRKLPASTEKLWLGQVSGAYVLVSEGAHGAAVYEIEGEKAGALTLLNATARRWPDAMANDRPDGIAAEAAGLGTTDLAMWLPLTSGLPDDATWFVPYLDRI